MRNVMQEVSETDDKENNKKRHFVKQKEKQQIVNMFNVAWLADREIWTFLLLSFSISFNKKPL